MAVDVTAAGATGTHAFQKTNVNLDLDYIYYKNSVGLPATFTANAPLIFRNNVGTLSGLTSGNLHYVKFKDDNTAFVQFSTSSNGAAANLTGVTNGSITFNYPFVYNNVLNVGVNFADQQAAKLTPTFKTLL